MNPLLSKGDQNPTLTLNRYKYRGEYERMAIHEGYKNNEWLQKRVGLSELYDIVDMIEQKTNKFLLSRIISYSIFTMMATSLILLGVGISNDYYLAKYNHSKVVDELKKEVASFWSLSWPFFTGFIFLPIVSITLYFLNKCVLNRYMNQISAMLNEENLKTYENRNLYWKIGDQCKNLQLSLIVINNGFVDVNDTESQQNSEIKNKSRADSSLYGCVIDKKYINTIPTEREQDHNQSLSVTKASYDNYSENQDTIN